MTRDTEWHIDKRVPLAFLVALVVQTAGFGIWIGRVEARLEHYAAQASALSARDLAVETELRRTMEMLVRLETRLQAQQDMIRSISEYLRRGSTSGFTP